MADAQEFNLDRSITEAWQAYTETLSDVLSAMDETSPLTIGTHSSVHDQAPFVRFQMIHRGQIFVEVSSNAVLGDGFQLSSAQLQQLSDLGWRSPSLDADPPSTNFTKSFSQDETDQLARDVVMVLAEVFGVYHPSFLEPDQLAEILQPSITHTPDIVNEDFQAIMPRNREHLEELLAQELSDLFGQLPFRDSDGDYAIRVGSTVVFARISTDGADLIVFAALVHEVEGRSAACEVLNDLNRELRYGKFSLHRDRVFVEMSVSAKPFVPAHLQHALRAISNTADQIDDDLARRLRGRTTFNGAGQ